jgi:Ca-activated chloride channel family protein
MTLCLAVFVLAVVALFGDNVRKLFGMSADGLAGNDSTSMRPAVASNTLQMKKLQNFALNSSYGDGPVAAGNTYAPVTPNSTVDTRADRLSTFAIDVDTASYSRSRLEIMGGAWPAPGGVRVEEWVNAFSYRLEPPTGRPFAISVEGAPSPIAEGHTLLKVSLQGRQVANAERDPAHLVYLVDTSGSMDGPDRIVLAKQAMRILTKNLNPRDTVSIVTYAGGVEDVLPPTPAGNQTEILNAIDELQIGGATAMESGMTIAYRHARQMVAPGHVSRVLVFTDGDANIGATTPAQILATVKDEVKAGVTLTAVGFGMGNYRDDMMEKLADAGNGQCVYIDSPEEARKVFETKISGTLQVIAKDVKVQVEFDLDAVRSYRLLGYEDRDVADKDFRDDEVDGGEIGAGHSVTALYDVVLAGHASKLGMVRVRGKMPDAHEAFEVARAISAQDLSATLEGASTELRFAAAVGIAADVVRGDAQTPATLLATAVRLAAGATRGLTERQQFVALLDRLAAHEKVALR